MALTSIIIAVPNEASAGSSVKVNVNIMNLTAGPMQLWCTVKVEGQYLSITPNEPWWTPAGWTSVFVANFIMPSKDVLITAESIIVYDEEHPEWVIDNTQKKWVYLVEAPPPPPPPTPEEPQFRKLAVVCSRR